jgi:hypothetical protein
MGLLGSTSLLFFICVTPMVALSLTFSRQLLHSFTFQVIPFTPNPQTPHAVFFSFIKTSFIVTFVVCSFSRYFVQQRTSSNSPTTPSLSTFTVCSPVSSEPPSPVLFPVFGVVVVLSRGNLLRGRNPLISPQRRQVSLKELFSIMAVVVQHHFFSNTKL